DEALGADDLRGLVVALADLEQLTEGQPLLGLFLLHLEVDVDEGAQALVLAEVAAGALVAALAEVDAGDLVDADPLGGVAEVLDHAPHLERGADRPGLAAVHVDDDLGLAALGLEALLDEVDLGLDGGEVVLGAALEHELAAELGEVGDLADIQPDVLRQHVGQAGHDLLGGPALALEVDDVGLHEHGAAVAEVRHRLGAEGPLGVLLDVDAEALGGALQEVAVAGRALGVELEVLDLAVLEDDDLDVLAADVADDVDVLVEVERALAVGHRLDDGRVGAEDVAEDVLGVAGGADAEDGQLRAGALDL